MTDGKTLVGLVCDVTAGLLSRASTEELMAARAYLATLTPTNCWWLTYRAEPFLSEVIRCELASSRRAASPSLTPSETQEDA